MQPIEKVPYSNWSGFLAIDSITAELNKPSVYLGRDRTAGESEAPNQWLYLGLSQCTGGIGKAFGLGGPFLSACGFFAGAGIGRVFCCSLSCLAWLWNIFIIYSTSLLCIGPYQVSRPTVQKSLSIQSSGGKYLHRRLFIRGITLCGACSWQFWMMYRSD